MKVAHHKDAVTFAPYVTEAEGRYLRSFKNAVKKSGFDIGTRWDTFFITLFAHPETGEAVRLHTFAAAHENEDGSLIKRRGYVFGYDNKNNVYKLCGEHFATMDNQSVLNRLTDSVEREAKEAAQGDPGDRDEWLSDQYEREAVDREMYG